MATWSGWGTNPNQNQNQAQQPATPFGQPTPGKFLVFMSFSPLIHVSLLTGFTGFGQQNPQAQAPTTFGEP